MSEGRRGWSGEKLAAYRCADNIVVHVRTYPSEYYKYGSKFRQQSASGPSNSFIYTKGYRRAGAVSVSGVFLNRDMS